MELGYKSRSAFKVLIMQLEMRVTRLPTLKIPEPQMFCGERPRSLTSRLN